MRKFEILDRLDFKKVILYVQKDLLNYVNGGKFEPFDITIEKHKIKRTNLQNDYYWANASEIAELLNKNGCKIQKMGIGCNWNRYDVDEVNKVNCGIESTSKLSTKEFGDLMENVFAFWIEKTKGKWQPKESWEYYINK